MREEQASKEGCLTGRSAGQEEEEEEDEEEVWRAGVDGMGEGDGAILAGVKGHCLAVREAAGDCREEREGERDKQRAQRDQKGGNTEREKRATNEEEKKGAAASLAEGRGKVMEEQKGRREAENEHALDRPSGGGHTYSDDTYLLKQDFIQIVL